MAKIKYSVTEDFGIRLSLTKTDSPLCEILFTEPTEGYITVGNTVAGVKGGICRFDPRRLDDGEYTPTLYREEGKSQLEGIIIRDGKVLPSPTSEFSLRRLFMRAGELEGRLAAAEEEISSLKRKTEKRLEF